MKLLNCTKCHDVVAFAKQTRTCACGETRGRYLSNGLTVLVVGPSARVLGMINDEYRASIVQPIVPFQTYFRWFPILLEAKHNVRLVADVAAYDSFTEEQPTTKTGVSRHRALCLVCSSVVESTHQRHFATCPCGQLSLDGGGGSSVVGRRIIGDMSRIQLLEDEGEYDREPVIAATPVTRLYKHALESIFSHLGISDIVHVFTTCRDWSAAVQSMRPTKATIDHPEQLNVIRNPCLMRHVEKISFFQVRLTQMTIDSLCDIIKQSNSLTVVNLNYTKIDYRGVSAIAEAIKQSQSLTTVDVSFNEIGDVGAIAIAEAIKQSKSLNIVHLYGNEIGDVGASAIAEAIKQSKSPLTTVDLRHNHIGAVGASAIAEAIKQSKSLTTVDLSGNLIGDVGAAAIAEAIKQSQSLTTVDLSCNEIGDVGVRAIAVAIKQSKSLVAVNARNNSNSASSIAALAEAIKCMKK